MLTTNSSCSEEYIDGDGATGCYTSSTLWVWQPRDEVKGDVARMIFYMATRYEGENGEPDLEVIDYIPADQYTNEPVHAKLSALLKWHVEDTVDNYERIRNEVIYSYQNNRNPFIDHPEYVDMIWGNTTSAETVHAESQLLIYPNPTNGNIYIKANNTTEGYPFRLKIINQAGSIVYESNINDTLTGIDLSRMVCDGLYFVQMIDSGGSVIDTQRIIMQ